MKAIRPRRFYLILLLAALGWHSAEGEAQPNVLLLYPAVQHQMPTSFHTQIPIGHVENVYSMRPL